MEDCVRWVVVPSCPVISVRFGHSGQLVAPSGAGPREDNASRDFQVGLADGVPALPSEWLILRFENSQPFLRTRTWPWQSANRGEAQAGLLLVSSSTSSPVPRCPFPGKLRGCPGTPEHPLADALSAMNRSDLGGGPGWSRTSGTRFRNLLDGAASRSTTVQRRAGYPLGTPSESPAGSG